MAATETVPASSICYTCRMTFDEDHAAYRTHYQSDLHRFNLKRKVAGFPPVPLDLFLAKVAASAVQKEEAKPTKGQTHLKKNKQRKKKFVPKQVTEEEALAAQEKAEAEAALSPEELYQNRLANATKLSGKDCLFDNHRARSFDANIRYMTKEYSFFIPEIEFLKDIKGLVKYLGEKLAVGHSCLYCEKSYSSLDAVRSHMRDSNHTMLKWEGNEKEYEDFFDWSTDDRFTEIEDDEGYVLPENTFVNASSELVLADGRKVGHRALKRYYDQHAPTQVQLISSLMQEHNRLEAIQRAKEKNLDKKTLQRIQRIRNKTSFQTNSQKHFRLQNPM